jgi:hypothetical protein
VIHRDVVSVCIFPREREREPNVCVFRDRLLEMNEKSVRGQLVQQEEAMNEEELLEQVCPLSTSLPRYVMY